LELYSIVAFNVDSITVKTTNFNFSENNAHIGRFKYISVSHLKLYYTKLHQLTILDPIIATILLSMIYLLIDAT
jgi:hypothetical protein